MVFHEWHLWNLKCFCEYLIWKIVLNVYILDVYMHFAAFYLFKDPEPYMLTGVGNSIIKMNLDGKDQRRIVSGVGRSIFLDFHLGEGTMFWADTHAGLINRAGLDGTNRQVVSRYHQWLYVFGVYICLLLQVWLILLEASLISKRNHRAGCGLDWKLSALERCGKRNDMESGHRWKKQKDCPTRPVSAKQCCCWSKWEVQKWRISEGRT